MKYYIIAGEASGDLHASRLMNALKSIDNEAQFRFFGGDLMAAQGGKMIKHYRELAYMGFVPVILHIRTIFKGMALCKHDIKEWKPDAVILIDYPGFNLDIAKFVHTHSNIPVYYYISPKIWAWKEWRIKNIKRYVDEMFSILPFEIHFYENKHHYHIHYVGNPTANEVSDFKNNYKQTFEEFCKENSLTHGKKIIALLAGSRKQEIKDNLPFMILAASKFTDYQLVLAGAPSIDNDYYNKFILGSNVKIVNNKTYPLLYHSSAALVTSGTATLETSLFDVPQVVCYETPIPHIIRFAFNHIIKVRFISLVNLIADKEIVKELLADKFTISNIQHELSRILPNGDNHTAILENYNYVKQSLGNTDAPMNTARIMYDLLTKKHK